MTTTIGDVLASGKSDDFSNVKISHSMKSKLRNVMKDPKQPRKRDSRSKEKIEQLKQKVDRVKHKAFVKCIEWAKTCDPIDLSSTGVM